MSIQNENFYFDKEEPNKSCLLAMRDFVLNFDSNISESKKYGIPCFSYANKAFWYLMVEKKSDDPYFLIVDGNLIDHLSLDSGDRKRMKILKVNPNKDLPIKDMIEVMKQSLALRAKK